MPLHAYTFAVPECSQSTTDALGLVEHCVKPHGLADFRIPVSAPNLGEAEMANVVVAMNSTRISSAGDFLDQFEQEFAQLVGVRHAIATSNGSTALHLALTAHGVMAGDEVVIPALTYVAVAHAVTHCGAIPVLADIDPATLTLSPETFEQAITAQTRAVVPVHLYGQPAAMDEILEIADRHGILVIEDAAEAHGAKIRGKTVGSIGDSATFSFYGNKIITTGEGGMVTTDDDALAARLRVLRNQGQQLGRAHWYTDAGFNYRMTNLAAAIGVAQVRRFHEIAAGFQQVGDWYRDALRGQHDFEIIEARTDIEAVDWLFTLFLRDESIDRDRVARALASQGIETRPVFHPLHHLPPYHDSTRCFQHAEARSRRGLSLPTSSLMTITDVTCVVECLVAAVAAERSERPVDKGLWEMAP